MNRRDPGVHVNIYNVFLFRTRKQYILFLPFAMFALFSWLWFSASIGLTSARVVPRNDGPVAVTKNGSYAGVYSKEYDQYFFLGVPYALPPVGELRFRTPQTLNGSWTGMKDAKEYSPECVGYGVRAFFPALNTVPRL
jgi:Carboxylesterase family